MYKMMKKASLIIFILTICITVTPYSSYAAESGLVYVISMKDEITPAMSAYLTEQVKLAENSAAKGVIIDISTLGGLVSSAIEMRDAILNSKIPVVVFVGDRAISAGALITIAADKIIMAPGSHMGSAEPIPYSEKAVAVVSGEFRSTAEANGRDPLIAAGMVDKNLEVPGFPKGILVNLTAEEAKDCGYADAILDNISEVLNFMGWSGAQVIEKKPDYRIRIAQFLTRHDVSSILLVIAAVALIIEIFMQGFGLPGIISIIAFILYFSGSFLAGHTEWWSILLLLLGMILFIVELYVPGFGVFGISGIILLVLGIIFTASTPVHGIISLSIALAATAILVPVLYKLLGGPKLFRRLVLTESETVDKGYVSRSPDHYSDLIGEIGEVVAPLRPVGTVLVDGKKLEAVSDGSYLPEGAKIKVIDSKGTQIIVQPVE